MPTCQKCGAEWLWTQTFKAMMRFRISMVCPYCEEKQYESVSSKRKTMLIGMLPIPLIFIFPYISGMTVWIAYFWLFCKRCYDEYHAILF